MVGSHADRKNLRYFQSERWFSVWVVTLVLLLKRLIGLVICDRAAV